MKSILRPKTLLLSLTFMLTANACAAGKPIGTNPGHEQRKAMVHDIGGQKVPTDPKL